MRVKQLANIILSLGILISSCKKGPDDPLISLKSRKGKLAQHWSMASGNVGLIVNSPSGPPGILSFEFNGSTGVVTNGYNTSYFNIKYSLSIDFDKKGRFKMTENLDGTRIIASGRWDFGSGVGDRKKKEDIFIQLDKVSNGDSRDHFFNHFSPEISYTIERISNTELRMFAHTNYYMNSKGEKGAIESSYIFRAN